MRTGPKHLPLAFHNPSRVFDAKRGHVCFWGYDRTMEISFFVGASLLRALDNGMADTESGFLEAFDAGRTRIQEIADKVYQQDRKGLYAFSLGAADI